MTDAEHLEVYRAILMQLCDDAGGELFVKMTPGYHEGGTIMHREEPGGFRIRFVKEGMSQ